jgi:hypothetical protein
MSKPGLTLGQGANEKLNGYKGVVLMTLIAVITNDFSDVGAKLGQSLEIMQSSFVKMT